MKRLLAGCVLLLLGGSLPAAEPFYLQGGETIVFFGDSITQAGDYVVYVDAFLATRFPDKQFRIINAGISSETISGTSEEDHQPRRPHADVRFARDVAAHKPDIVVACFGMNDGNYHPFDEERFAKYKAGVQRLADRCKQEAGARLVLMTPPPFDPYRRSASDPNAVSFGYKFAAIDYDNTLAAYSEWLVSLAGPDRVVADVHSALNDHLRRRRAKKVSFYLAGDAVHPGPTGHWLMAQTLLLAWNAPAEAADAKVNAEKGTVQKGDVKGVIQDGKALRFTWKTPLPLPVDPQWDKESIALERVSERLNRYRLTVTGLKAGKYRLVADGVAVNEFDADEFGRGIDVAALANFPAVQKSQQVLALIQKRRRGIYAQWRQSIAPDKRPDEKASVRSVRQAEEQFAEQLEQIRKLCQPADIALTLEPIETK